MKKKKINLNPKPRSSKPKFPIKVTYHGWNIIIELCNNVYYFLGSRLWTKNNVVAITRSYTQDCNLKSCLATFKVVLDSEIKTKEKKYEIWVSKDD
jgi:hypothetical protein